MTARTYAERLGAQLRAQRKLLRLNQTEVADLAGTTQRSVSQAESGRAATLELYASIAEVLGLELVAQPRERRPNPGAGSGVGS